jgi:hypothetical protein
LELRTKALHFILTRTENWNCEQKHQILFSRAAKVLEIATKSTVFCSENFGIANKSNLPTKATLKFQFFLFSSQLTAFLSATQRNFLKLRPRAVYFVQLRSETFGICQQKSNSN